MNSLDVQMKIKSGETKKVLKDEGCKFICMMFGKDRNRPELENILVFVRKEDIVDTDFTIRLAKQSSLIEKEV